MPTFRIYKNKNYTVMSNKHLKDKRITYKAKGLLSFMLSLPEDWDYSINGLAKVSKEGNEAIKAILKELQNNGYLDIIKKRNEKGHYEYEYQIYEISKFDEFSTRGEKPTLVTPEVVNPIQINTKEQNTKKKKSRKKKVTEDTEILNQIYEN